MLDKDTLISILTDWNYWDSPPPPSVPRKAIRAGFRWDEELITVVQGVRRCGKSTLLTQLVTQNKLDPAVCFFINFEDPRLAENLDTELLDLLLSVARARQKNKAIYLFLDEIQAVKHWEKWLHKQVERPRGCHLVVTGSNASLLGTKMSSALTGRHRTIELFPFDFTEFQAATRGDSFEHYLVRGGFPKPLSIQGGDDLLREYFLDIIERDARRQIATRSPQTLPLVAKSVFESTGSKVSLRKLANIFDSTPDSLRTYVSALLSSYLILECPYFSYSERKRSVRPIKYYPIDTGLHRSVITRSGSDNGKYLETIVFHFLRRKHKRVYYWKGKQEVDFVVQDGSTIVPIQVSWDGPKDRHREALTEFRKEFPKAASEVWISRENVERFLE